LHNFPDKVAEIVLEASNEEKNEEALNEIELKWKT